MLKIWKTSKHSSRSQESQRTAPIDSARGIYKLKVIENVFWNICYLMQKWIIFSCWWVGFAASFSTLAIEAFKSNLHTNRKAAFSVAWMKFLSNFLPGKTMQEQMIMERVLSNLNQQSDSCPVHSVLSVIH